VLRVLHLVIEVEDQTEASEVLSEFKKELKLLLQKFWERGMAKEINFYDTYDDPVSNVARSPKVYWFQKPPRKKDILVFDAGYANGTIHIYDHKETLDAAELENQLKKHGQGKSWRILKE